MRQGPKETTRDRSGARTEELRKARAALEELVPVVTGLVRESPAEAPAVGEWRVLDVALHLSHVSAGELFMARTVGGPPGPGLPIGDDLVTGVATFNGSNIATDKETDLSVIAERIENNVSELLDVMGELRGDEEVGWLGGTVLPASCLAAHLVGEFVIHGVDIGRAGRREFRVDPGHAALGFGFFLDVMRFCPPNMRPGFVAERARDLTASIELDLRGARRHVVVFEGGAAWVEDPLSREVDCHISADPRVAYLAGFERISPIRAALSGRMLAWGRKPWLAFQLPRLLRNP